MVQFKDKKKEKACASRVANGKKAKSGKRLHIQSLQKMESEEKFLAYIKAIGFECLLEHSLVEVPVDLAKEFFTSFQFKTTTDLYTMAIRFRVFNREMEMSLQEWSWRMGLVGNDEEERGWNEREICPPQLTEGYNVDEAWSLITHEGAGQFRTSFSKGDQIINPVLRLTQVFLAYNLLGQANLTITTAEVYFMWCMLKGVKVHMGYWIALACHTIATHLVCHLYASHLLGAYLQRNIVMEMPRPRLPLIMCDAPGLFNLSFFVNTKLVKQKGSGFEFYEAGQPEIATVKEEKVVEETPTASTEPWKKMMEDMLCKLGEATVVQKGLFELQTDRMTNAITLMERTVILAEKNTQLALLYVASGSQGSQPSRIENPQQATPEVILVEPAVSEPESAPTKGKEVTTTSQPAEKESEEPTPSCHGRPC